ncbi:MAG TPA: phosphate ABC transporter permease PstA [Gaiellales bacterium]|jgi:phosphate transport system permease protein|nr:phosphate ABC transporter permease PstA [Gaiellales bacterium]
MSAAAHQSLSASSGRAKRRRRWGRVMEGLATLAAVVAIAVLAIVIISVAKKGLPALNADLFTQVTSTFGIPGEGGGIKNAIIGTVIMTAIATAISVPLGVLLAIFSSEFAPPRLALIIRITLNVLAGVPTIVIGVFVFGLLVVGNGYSAYAAGVALSIVQLPVVARSTEEVLLLVPSSLREASMALGASRARTVLTVILPTAVGGIVTATIVAVARAAGETAPLLFTTGIFANAVVTDPTKPMASIPLVIFQGSESPSPHDQEVAWAAALVLLVGVLIGSSLGRLLSLRSRRRIEQSR